MLRNVQHDKLFSEVSMSFSILWHGHSNMQIFAGGVSVLIDPFFEGNPFAPDWKSIPRPDVVLVTHDHGDHLGQAVEIARETGAALGAVVELAEHCISAGVPASQVTGWNLGGTVELHGVRVTMVQAFHTCAHGTPVGFVLELPGGGVVYHAGDTALFGDMTFIGNLFSPDVALLPIGGFYTMDGRQAAHACSLLGVPQVIPMHYGTFPVIAPDADAFVSALEKEAPECRALCLKPGEKADFEAKNA